MGNDDLKQLRERLVSAISGGESHITFEKVAKDFPAEARGVKPHGAPHTAWELIEHMRIAQRDILEFSRDAKHQSPKFPEGYWPQTAAPPDGKAWDATVAAFLRDERELKSLIQKADLFTPFEHGEGQNLLRESLLVANHNSYQLGQLVFLKKMLTTDA
jgi:DinB superfamily